MTTSLSTQSARAVANILTLSAIDMPAALDIVDSLNSDELATVSFLGALTHRIVATLGLPVALLPCGGIDEGSPATAAARMVVAASACDHDMLHALATVATRQPREWRDQLVTHLLVGVRQAAEIRAAVAGLRGAS